jgi:hypothetical protein
METCMVVARSTLSHRDGPGGGVGCCQQDVPDANGGAAVSVDHLPQVLLVMKLLMDEVPKLLFEELYVGETAGYKLPMFRMCAGTCTFNLPGYIIF